MATLKYVGNTAFQAGTLSASATASATELAVGSGEGTYFPSTGDFWVRVDDEIFKITSRSTDSLIGTGGQDQTTIATHAATSPVTWVIGSSALDAFKYENVSIFEPDRFVGSASSAKLEYSTLTGGGTTTLLDYTGGEPGYITSIWVGISGTDADNHEKSKLQIYLDGGTTASIDEPLGLMCCSAFTAYTSRPAVSTPYFGNARIANNTSHYFKLPIPFSTGIKICLTNGDASVSMTVWAFIEYRVGVPNLWHRTRKLQIETGTVTGTHDVVCTFVDVSGLSPGMYAGLYLSMDGYPGTANPRTGPLEGNIKVYLDGGTAATIESPGTEDYFNQGNYFMEYASGQCSEYIGVPYKSSDTYDAYRLHIPDPILFQNALKITWNSGDSSQVHFTGYATTVYTVFYYTE